MLIYVPLIVIRYLLKIIDFLNIIAAYVTLFYIFRVVFCFVMPFDLFLAFRILEE
jgi:hypothetical protein